MVTAKDVNELLTKYTKKEFLDITLNETELLDYRSKILVAHIWIELLMECILIKKFKNHKDIVEFGFSKKREILFGLGIINEDMNHEFKILNKIRAEFAHQLYPLQGKLPNLIRKFKMYPKNKTKKEGIFLSDAVAFGMITGILTRYLVEILWEIQSKEKKKQHS